MARTKISKPLANRITEYERNINWIRTALTKLAKSDDSASIFGSRLYRMQAIKPFRSLSLPALCGIHDFGLTIIVYFES